MRLPVLDIASSAVFFLFPYSMARNHGTGLYAPPAKIANGYKSSNTNGKIGQTQTITIATGAGVID